MEESNAHASNGGTSFVRHHQLQNMCSKKFVQIIGRDVYANGDWGGEKSEFPVSIKNRFSSGDFPHFVRNPHVVFKHKLHFTKVCNLCFKDTLHIFRNFNFQKNLNPETKHYVRWPHWEQSAFLCFKITFGFTNCPETCSWKLTTVTSIHCFIKYRELVKNIKITLLLAKITG